MLSEAIFVRNACFCRLTHQSANSVQMFHREDPAAVGTKTASSLKSIPWKKWILYTLRLSIPLLAIIAAALAGWFCSEYPASSASHSLRNSPVCLLIQHGRGPRVLGRGEPHESTADELHSVDTHGGAGHHSH